MTAPDVRDLLAERARRTVGVLEAQRLGLLPPGELPPAAELARQQVAAAVARGRLDLSGAPQWAWGSVASLLGPMLPGDFIVVGALLGNGKTSFLLTQMDAFAKAGTATLYLPLETDPEVARRQWAAWRLGLDWRHVARNAWDLLPEGSRDAHEELMAEQGDAGLVHFPPDRRVTLAKLTQWVRWGLNEGVGCVMIDHFHRMDFGGAGRDYRVQVTEAVRSLKDLAREARLPILAAAQLNRTGATFDRYHPPTIDRLKESAGIGEEADTVLMLARRFARLPSKDEVEALKAGHGTERDFEARNVMQVVTRKHRLDDEARDRIVLLKVEQGKVRDFYYGEEA